MRAHLLLAPVLAATALMVGCEWTSSDGITWDESFDNVNFSGTYNLSQNVSSSEEGTETPGGSYSQSWKGNKSSGTVGTAVIAGSVSVTATIDYNKQTATFSDNGDGVLSGGTNGDGTINYTSGAWSIPTKWVMDNGGSKIVSGTVAYATSAISTPGNTTVIVSHVTVHQTGQNLTLTFSNGYTFSGKISGYNTDSDSIGNASSVIAKFTATGKYGTVTGTLNSLASSRQIDGVWTNRGKACAIVGSTIGAGRNISENTEAVGDE